MGNIIYQQTQIYNGISTKQQPEGYERMMKDVEIVSCHTLDFDVD